MYLDELLVDEAIEAWNLETQERFAADRAVNKAKLERDLLSTGGAPVSTWPVPGGSWLARAYCIRSAVTVQITHSCQDDLVPSSPLFVVLLGSVVSVASGEQ